MLQLITFAEFDEMIYTTIMSALLNMKLLPAAS